MVPTLLLGVLRGLLSEASRGFLLALKKSRDPYIIHLNIALSMVVSPCLDRKSHVSTGQNVSFQEP